MKFDQYRYFLKDSIRKSINFQASDQNKGFPAPPVEKPFDENAPRIPLPMKDQWPEHIKTKDLFSAMANRKSRRRFTSEKLCIEELAFLLWATQGLRQTPGINPAFRTVPSAGARHSFETYLFMMRVEGLHKGLYRYLPTTHEIMFINEIDKMEEKLSRACFGQRFIATGAVTFVWTTVPYRMEWRYMQAAHRVILMDAGHVCQNLYLACEAINSGTCAIGAYNQEAMDELIAVDGEDEFTIYLAPVGKL